MMGRGKVKQKLMFRPHPLTNHPGNKKIKNDKRALKPILYDMGHLTIARWLFQKAMKFKRPMPTIPPPKKFEKYVFIQNNFLAKSITLSSCYCQAHLQLQLQLQDDIASPIWTSSDFDPN